MMSTNRSRLAANEGVWPDTFEAGVASQQAEMARLHIEIRNALDERDLAISLADRLKDDWHDTCYAEIDRWSRWAQKLEVVAEVARTLLRNNPTGYDRLRAALAALDEGPLTSHMRD